jgi:hypothetical protein
MSYECSDFGLICELGRRARNTPSWEWMSGMRIMNGRSGPRGTVLEGSKDYAIWWGEGSTREGGGWQEQCPPHSDIIPDLSDPATVGCLLFLVRKVSKIPNAWTVERNGKWYMCWSGATHGGDMGIGETEVEALVDALCHADLSQDMDSL